MRRALFAIVFSFAAICAFANPRDFNIDVVPVFEGQNLWPSAPLFINIENKGPDAKGSLFLGEQDNVTRYPIDLPRGAKKRLVVYPSPSVYGSSSEMFLDTDQGRMQVPYVSKNGYSYGNMLNIVAYVSSLQP